MNTSGRPTLLLMALLLPMTGCQDAAPEAAVATTSDTAATSDTTAADVTAADDTAADDTAADVTLTVTDEHGFAEVIASLQGHVVLVDFWASWCVPCLAGFPHTVELYEEFHDRGLEVVSVSFDEVDNHDAALAFLQKNRAVFTNLQSKHGFDSEIPFQTEGALPVLRVYDAEGDLVAAFASGDPTAPPFTPEDVRRAVQQAIETLESAAPDKAPETDSDG